MTFALTYPAATGERRRCAFTARAHLTCSGDCTGGGLGLYLACQYGDPFAAGGHAFNEAGFTSSFIRKGSGGGWQSALRRPATLFLSCGMARTQTQSARGDVRHTYSYSISQPSRTLNDFVERDSMRTRWRRVLTEYSATPAAAAAFKSITVCATRQNRAYRQNHFIPRKRVSIRSSDDDGSFERQRPQPDARLHRHAHVSQAFRGQYIERIWVKRVRCCTRIRAAGPARPRKARFYLMSGNRWRWRRDNEVDVPTVSESRLPLSGPIGPLLLSLDEWVSAGKRPPESEIPRHGDRVFAVTVPGSQTGFVPQHELGLAEHSRRHLHRRDHHALLLDFGPTFGGHRDELSAFHRRAPCVSDLRVEVDKDGNEKRACACRAWPRPIATTTGWASVQRPRAGTTAAKRTDNGFRSMLPS